MKLDS